jgi:hypothetical protein
VHDFVLWGFNEAERSPGAMHDRRADNDHQDDRNRRDNEKVFEGVLNWIGGGNGIFMNYRFAQPMRTHRQHIARWTPEFQFPFANAVIFDPVTGQVDGRLARCKKTNTCPKIFETNSENEYWAKGGSMLTTDGQGHDLDLDDLENVRYYLLSSLPHGAGTVPGICQQPQNPLVGNQVTPGIFGKPTPDCGCAGTQGFVPQARHAIVGRLPACAHPVVQIDEKSPQYLRTTASITPAISGISGCGSMTVS